MIGFILTALGTSAEEIGIAFGKKNVQSKKIGTYGVMALHTIVSMCIFLLTVLFWPGAFVFSALSLPFFLARAFFEVLQMYMSTQALVRSDRTTFSFVRTLTIPLLLAVDVFLGYSLSLFQIAGIVILTIAILAIFSGKRFSKAGIGYVLFSAINAVITISLFKYNIAHFNSIAAEQLGILSILALYAIIGRYVSNEPNPFSLVLRERPIFWQVLSESIGGVLQSFAFLFLPPSIMIAVKRSTSVFWSLVSGHFVFHEQHLLWKGATLTALVASLALLIMGA
jgi:drug/metabolite transporter (DMT)-like permease